LAPFRGDPMTMSRRDFVQTSAVAAASAATLASAAIGDDAAPSPIIDCHQHLWNLEEFSLPWLKPGGLLGRSYVMSDYLEAIRGTGIKHAVYMEVDVAANEKQKEVDFVVDLCKAGNTPTIAAVVGGSPA